MGSEMCIRDSKYSVRLVVLYPRRLWLETLGPPSAWSVPYRVCPANQANSMDRRAYSAAAAGPGVRLVINLGKVLKIKVGIDLGGGDIRVAQQFLYGTQIRT